MADGFVDAGAVRNGTAPPPYHLLREFPSLGRYVSWRHLGGGAFGTVFAGVHRNHGRIEAIKRVAIADARARTLALAETGVMAQLPPHPHLVTLYDAEETDGALFLIMQYVDGQPLDALTLPAPVDKVLSWTRDTADALALIHAYGIVHRDIKPANVFTTRTGAGVLGDYGVARAFDSRDGTAAIAGTPVYMAPEAFVGRATAASDLWSLGVMLYELTTGRRPFPLVEDLPLDQMGAALLHARFEFPSVVRPGLPGRVDDLCLALLAPSPGDRPASAMEVLDHLPRYSTVVSAIEADLTKLDVDAIVVSANEQLAMHIVGSAAHAVAEAGGQAIIDDTRRQAPAKVGTCVISGSGRLAVRFVLHAVTLRVDDKGFLGAAREGDIRKALWSALRRAHELRVESLGIPAMGTYSGGLAVDEAARMMVDVVHSYLLEFRPPLKRVVFALTDKPVAIAFREAALHRGMIVV